MSEESVSTITSSKIRDFGLYRTIDARADEFLRLSRKRQIRQGCVCAAISTAITVAVVVSILLAYEYHTAADKDQKYKNRDKPGWLDLINDSETSDSDFDLKFSKNNINFDKTTLKLLPMLIKALNKNRHLEKIIEDYSTVSPPEITVPQETSVFSNFRHWIKMPTRLFTIEYKTSPIIVFRKDTTATDYFSRIRKIRDEQRITNYIDKMITDKTGHTTESMYKHLYSDLYVETSTQSENGHSIFPWITSMKRRRRKYKETTTKIRTLPKVTSKSTTSQPKRTLKVKCKCSNQMREVLSSIAHGFKQLFPLLTLYKQCNSSVKTDEKQTIGENEGFKVHRTKTTSLPYQNIMLKSKHDKSTEYILYKKPGYTDQYLLALDMNQNPKNYYYPLPTTKKNLKTTRLNYSEIPMTKTESTTKKTIKSTVTVTNIHDYVTRHKITSQPTSTTIPISTTYRKKEKPETKKETRILPSLDDLEKYSLEIVKEALLPVLFSENLIPGKVNNTRKNITDDKLQTSKPSLRRQTSIGSFKKQVNYALRKHNYKTLRPRDPKPIKSDINTKGEILKVSKFSRKFQNNEKKGHTKNIKRKEDSNIKIKLTSEKPQSIGIITKAIESLVTHKSYEEYNNEDDVLLNEIFKVTTPQHVKKTKSSTTPNLPCKTQKANEESLSKKKPSYLEIRTNYMNRIDNHDYDSNEEDFNRK